MKAVNGLDLTVARGELFALLGSSGSGKTTLLRLLAGLETPHAGTVTLDGIDMTRTPPHKRPVNMMFQSYALFPHMDVQKNVGYGLRREGLGRREVRDRVLAMLESMGLEGKASRRPDQLSGGERQRVALARALVKRPKLLLLDEPLAALDRKLREHTQFELMNLQDRLGVTFVVVTHDQQEAMALATRIGVMRDGRLQQVGDPAQVYEHPNSRYVADFVGSVNLFPAKVLRMDGAGALIRAIDAEFEVLLGEVPAGVAEGLDCWLAVRPEKLRLHREKPDQGHGVTLPGRVVDTGYFGNASLHRVALADGRIVQVSVQNRRRVVAHHVAVDDDVFLSCADDSFVLLTE